MTGVIFLEIFSLCKRKERKILLENMEKRNSCAFTGHRPEKVIGSEGKIIVELSKEILKAWVN